MVLMMNARESRTSLDPCPTREAKRGPVPWLHQVLTRARYPFTAPLLLTLARVLATPMLVLGVYFQWDRFGPVCALIIAMASLTDWLDGALARWLRQTSRLGEFLDPIADKLLVVSALMLLNTRALDLFVLLPSLVIVMREMFVLALREWSARCGAEDTLRVSTLAKWKTAIQMTALVALFLPPNYVPFQNVIAEHLLWLAAALAVASACDYGARMFARHVVRHA